MADVASLNGSLTAGPPTVGDAAFPTGATDISLALIALAKPAPANTGVQKRTLASPSAYVALAGVPSTVAQADTFYLRTSVEMLVRLTFFGSGGDTTSVIPIKGLLMIEVDPSKYLKHIEVQGSGVVEWFAGGSL